MFEDMKNEETSMGDIVIWGTDIKLHLQKVKKMLDICKRNNVTLNREKCQIAVTELTFLCNRRTADGLKPDPAKVKPIEEFTTPKEQAGVPRFLGVIKYLAIYTENLSQRTFHMRSLLKANVVFTWGPEHEKEFNELKKLLSSQPLI